MNLLKKVAQLEKEADDFGFSWERPEQILQQIQNEYAEIVEQLQVVPHDRKALQEEIGDLVHAVFSLCVFCKFEPDDTLDKTLAKFERRLNAVKSLAQGQGFDSLNGHSFDALMQFWDKAKILVG